MRWLWMAWLAVASLQAVLFSAYTLPRSLQARSLSQRVETLRAEVEHERKELERGRERTRVAQENLQDLNAFYHGVIGERKQSLLPLLDEVEATATQLGLRPQQESYSYDPVAGLPITKVGITMPLRGSYRQLVAFLDKMERSSRFVTVEQLRIGGGGRGAQAQLDVVLSSYFRATQ